MLTSDALVLLALTQDHVTPSDVKTAYRKACSKYHPDRNPHGLEMMKAINSAYEALKGYEGPGSRVGGGTEENYPEKLSAALKAIINLAGLEIEVCGSWVWVTGDTKTHKAALKDAGYRWAGKKVAWYFRPADYKSKARGNWSLDDIRASHGSRAVHGKKQRVLKSA